MRKSEIYRNEIKSYIYSEAVELADALGYDIVWQKRRD